MQLEGAQAIRIGTGPTAAEPVTALAVAGSDLVVATASGRIQVNRLNHLLARRLSGLAVTAFDTAEATRGRGPMPASPASAPYRSPPLAPSLWPWGREESAQEVFSARPHTGVITSLAVALSPAGGLVVCSAGDDGRVVVTPVGSGPPRMLAKPDGRGLAATFAGRLHVAGLGPRAVWVWPVEEAGETVHTVAVDDDTASAIEWLHGAPSPTLCVGWASGRVTIHSFDGTSPTTRVLDPGPASDGATDDGSRAGPIVGLATWAEGDWWAVAVASERGTIDVGRVRAGTETLAPTRWLHRSGAAPISSVTLTRGLLGVVTGDQLELHDLRTSGSTSVRIGTGATSVVLARTRGGAPAVAWIDAAGSAELAPVDLTAVGRGAGPLKISGDRPQADQDLLGFDSYARPFAALVANRATNTPLTVAIDGRWGAGKTSLGLMIDQELRRAGPSTATEVECVPVWFDAWMHDGAQNLASALTNSVTARLHALRPWWQRVAAAPPAAAASFARRYARVVGTVLAVVAGAVLVAKPAWLESALAEAGVERGPTLLSIGGLTVTGGLLRLAGLVRNRFADAIEAFARSSDSVANDGRIGQVRTALGRRLHSATAPIPDPWNPSGIPLLDRIRGWARDASPGRLLRPVQRALAAALGVRADRRIVLFVDDLDRCRPERAVEALEALSQLLDHDGVVTVAMVDLDALAADAEVVFDDLAAKADPGGGWGRRFLDKIFQFEFTIPTHRPAALAAVLRGATGDQRAEAAVEPAPSPPDPTADGGLAALEPVATTPPPRVGVPSWTDPQSPGPSTPPVSGSFGDSKPWLTMFNTLGVVVSLAVAALVDSDQPAWLKVTGAIVVLGAVGAVSVWRSSSEWRDRMLDRRESPLPPFSVPASAGAATVETIDLTDPSPLDDATRGPLATVAPEVAAASIPLQRRAAIRAVLHEGDHLELGRQEAERWLTSSSPRTAKRLANRLVFTLAVATDRGLLWTDSPLDGQLIGRWISLAERWPMVAGAIRRDPSVLRDLDQTAHRNDASFHAALRELDVPTADRDRLRELLRASPRLALHADALATLAQ